MDFFICIPVLLGCPTKVKPAGDPAPRICPRCSNASVQEARARTWLEVCFVPLVPLRARHVWTCAICQWQVPLQDGWQPTPAHLAPHPHAHHPHPHNVGEFNALAWQHEQQHMAQQHPHAGYAPAYVQPAPQH